MRSPSSISLRIWDYVSIKAMKVIRISTHAQGGGNEITDKLAKHPGWKIEAVFPLRHVSHNNDHRDFFVLMKQEE
jgi:hypothetical protein